MVEVKSTRFKINKAAIVTTKKIVKYNICTNTNCKDLKQRS
ncbi:protein of unknown function [Candidatus Nitrosocaldus cavascurensis]|uniref:Uncharacterized protein n=1 Tax=Candidatus Nitrosocaldus cavascurensis TaxID=2058097 RepID=A0A2K5ARA8_9ARCH|nr:protein of unknown function [Candidatus Nitrosocaldus cavascurensis]